MLKCGLSRWGVLVGIFLFCRLSLGLFTGGEGSTPIKAVDLPAGALDVLDHSSRIAWWEGPAFGGGNYHCDYRGDTQTLADVVQKFGKIQSRRLYLVLHDGQATSSWLSAAHRDNKQANLKVDYTFSIWRENHEKYAGMTHRLDDPTGDNTAPRLDVYTDGGALWKGIEVPQNVTLIDCRLVSHGYALADGTVTEGVVTDLQTQKPIDGASVLIRKNTLDNDRKINYEDFQTIKTDAKGHWVIKNLKVGAYQLVVSGEGYVPRTIGYVTADSTPRWSSFTASLSRPASFSGIVSDMHNAPLAGVEIHVGEVQTADGDYGNPSIWKCISDSTGNFKFDGLPIGQCMIDVRKENYVMPGLPPTVSFPKDDLKISMIQSAQLKVKIKFPKNNKPMIYNVNISPQAGSQIGKYSGGSYIDADNVAIFKNIIPDDYVVTGAPNPSTGNQSTNPYPISLKPGDKKEIEIDAK